MIKVVCAVIALMPALCYAQQISSGSPPLTVVASAGAASVTGTTNETNLAAIKIPAGTMGPNGSVELKCLWTFTNSANTKTFIIRWNQTSGATAGGSTGSNVTATTSATMQEFLILRNNNATNSQTSFSPTPTTPFGNAASSLVSSSIDTTQDAYLNVNGQLASGAETITLQHCYATIYRSN